MTTAAEVWIGVFIAGWIYIQQQRTSNSLEDLVQRIKKYDEEQEQLQRIVRHRFLDQIEWYLSLAYMYMDFDRGIINDANESQRLDIVENLLRRSHDRPPDTEPRIVKKLEFEYGQAREREVTTRLVNNLNVIIDDMKLLYGIPVVNFLKGDIVQNWLRKSDMCLSKITETNEIIKQIRNPENNKASSS